MMDDTELVRLAEMIALGKRMDEHLTSFEADNLKKDILEEMAYERKMFKAIITNISMQIIQNWCLINYASLTGDKSDLINHWKSELKAHLGNAASNKIKRNNSIASRIKALKEIWYSEKEYGKDPNVINLSVFSKFSDEGIDTNTQYYNQILLNCMNASESIIKVIADANDDEITKYVENL